MIGLLLMMLVASMTVIFSTTVPVISTGLGIVMTGLGGYGVRKVLKQKSEIKK